MENVQQSLNFTGRKVLVTGGARGIGKAMVKMFSEAGATVYALDISKPFLAELKVELPGVITVQADVSNWEEVEKVLAPLHPIHHLVNNAGIMGKMKPLLSVEKTEIESVLNVNLTALIRVSQIVARGMIDHKIEGATIVNLSSIASSIYAQGTLVYGSTKAAVVYVTKAMAHELAVYKIRVNCVRPAAVQTEMAEGFPPELIKAVGQRMVYGQQLIQPVEVAKGAVYLSSPLSNMMTGSAITIDAGRETW